MNKKYILFILLALFIFFSYKITSLYEKEKRIKLTKSNYKYLTEKVELYKSVYSHYPETLNNLITDTYIKNGKETFFIAAVPAEFLSSKYSNAVQLIDPIKENGNGWWYDNKTGKILLNNKKNYIDFK